MDTYQLHLEKGAYTLRQLREDEARLYKAIRLEAIRTEPSMFRTSTPAEESLSDIEWQKRLQYPRVVFGLFENNTLIGMTSLLLSDEEGYLGQSYIRKEHRGRGMSALLYKARLDKAYELGLKRLTVSHRESNIISKAANQRAGFTYTHREPAVWLDGTMEDVLYYELDL